ncbi:hypothetical protein [Azospirillum sp. SYSU D00513]|uniref:hypothetical protein n=1 Tax=Azospirillum sp. SYSU D00513 TaxID=2812561 RepID=UPI001A95C0B9|nr:hypothetical protein [Azospirillum sp. SYSU D00513]
MSIPAYGTGEYWAAYARGLISDDQALRDGEVFHARQSGIAVPSKARKAPRRVYQPAPMRRRQYTRAMSTRADRDQRINAEALRTLRQIVALSGNRGFVETTKGALASAFGVSLSSIKRHLRVLQGDLGPGLRGDAYIVTDVIKRGGKAVGLRILLTSLVEPFYKSIKKSTGGSDTTHSKVKDSKNKPFLPKPPQFSRTDARSQFVRIMRDVEEPILKAPARHIDEVFDPDLEDVGLLN